MASAKAPSKLVLEFAVEEHKTTPNTKRFKQDEPADGSRPEVGTLYVTKKGLLPLGDTRRIRVTIEAAD